MSTTPPFRFVEHPPDPRLRPWVQNYWEFTVGEGAPATHHVPPDGCTSVLLAMQPRGGSPLLASGPWTTPLVLPVRPGQRTRGFRITPGAAPGLLGLAADALVCRVLPLSTAAALPVDRLAPALAEGDLATMAGAVDRLLLSIRDALPAPDRLAASALRLIRETAGGTPLSAIAAQVECSPRTLRRRVRHATGLTPKQYARIIRFGAAAREMLRPDTALSRVATQGGYADQPHFHHEAVTLTGLTPAELAGRVRQIEHRFDR